MAQTERAEALSRLRELALAQHRKSLRTGHDPHYGRRFEYVRPSPGRYNWMWFWDSCFHIVSLSCVDTRAAKAELDTMLASQDEHGFIGHLVYWGRFGSLYSALFTQSRPLRWRARHSHMIQPAFLAQALERLHVATGDLGYLKEVLPRVIAYYDWLDRARSYGQQGLLAAVSPFESGLDNSPAYDAPMGIRKASRTGWLVRLKLLDARNSYCGGRPGLPGLPANPAYLVHDLLVNYAFADGLRTLARLRTLVGDAAGARKSETRAESIEAGVRAQCWNEKAGLFYHVDALTGRQLEVSTIASLLPALFPSTPDDIRGRVIGDHLRNPEEYWLDFPLPTVARSEAAFDPSSESMIWRGPVAMPMNWVMVRGLRQVGFADEAAHIAERSMAMATGSGFREFYDPLSGRGLRGTNFGWATTVVDL